jgi:ribulose-phosphate 3-epimerase
MKKISVSILSIKDNIKENIKVLDNLNIDYIHLDIMDGNFVPNKTWDIEEIENFITNHRKPLDVHLMVSDIKKYIDDFSKLDPEYITFHYEATSDPANVIAYIQSNGIKAGISINPSTDVEELLPYLSKVDLVLVMSVEAGKGGQKYISTIDEKIDELELVRKAYNYNYVIEVDGGITNETIIECANADMFVVGTYITGSDNYEEKIKELKSSI